METRKSDLCACEKKERETDRQTNREGWRERGSETKRKEIKQNGAFWGGRVSERKIVGMRGMEMAVFHLT